MTSADPATKTALEKKLAKLRLEMHTQYRVLKREEKAQRAALRKREKEFLK
jgi:hypothetical protein